MLPARGVIIWNSHAFNLSTEDTTVELYNSFMFASEEQRVYRRRVIFDTKDRRCGPDLRRRQRNIFRLSLLRGRIGHILRPHNCRFGGLSARFVLRLHVDPYRPDVNVLGVNSDIKIGRPSKRSGSPARTDSRQR